MKNLHRRRRQAAWQDSLSEPQYHDPAGRPAFRSRLSRLVIAFLRGRPRRCGAPWHGRGEGTCPQATRYSGCHAPGPMPGPASGDPTPFTAGRHRNAWTGEDTRRTGTDYVRTGTRGRRAGRTRRRRWARSTASNLCSTDFRRGPAGMRRTQYRIWSRSKCSGSSTSGR